jgi:hypothetical protein
VRTVRATMGIGTVLAVLACLGLSGPPALASPRHLELADGRALTVWEQRGPAPGGGESWSIDYCLRDLDGSIFGVVPITADAAADSAPFLALDAIGSPVLVWSRFDGSNRKIAYARLSAGEWTDFHFLTFGPGDDLEPRVGTSAAGSYLFYFDRPDRYLYAPLDLSSGRLFAAPRLLNLGNARRDIGSRQQLGDITTYGGVDAPIVTGRGGTPRSGTVTDKQSLFRPGGISPQGGVDVPVVSGGLKAAAWGVASNEDCLHMILVIPARDLKTVFVFRFNNGVMDLLTRIPTPATTIEIQFFGADTAASHLPLICY